MAYERAFTDENDVPVGAWKILRRNNEYDNRVVWFVIAGYIDQAAADAWRKPLVESPYTMQDVDPATVTDDDCLEYAALVDAKET